MEFLQFQGVHVLLNDFLFCLFVTSVDLCKTLNSAFFIQIKTNNKNIRVLFQEESVSSHM